LTQTSIKYTAEEKFQERSVQIAQRVSFLPELLCSFDNDVETNCIDWHKLRSFATVYNESDEFFLFYQEDFKFSTITLTRIYPPPEESFVLYDNPVENVSKISTFVPVSIKDDTRKYERAYSLGILKIEVYK
jgi:hypothetical protein